MALELPEEGRSRSFAIPAWLEGRVHLELEARGTGSGRVELVEEDGGREVVAELRSPRLDAEVALPGGGRRPVRLEFSLEGELRWRSARLLRDPADEPAPAGDELIGALKGRSVVFILTDALYAAHMSCYGNRRSTSPALDRMAAEGVRFEEMYSQTCWTVPSVATIFTSLEQEYHGVARVESQLPAEHPTLAEAFRRAGYRTVGLIQNGLLVAKPGLDRGFDRYEHFPWDVEGALEDLLEQARGEILDGGEAPLFLYLHLIPPHSPFLMPDDFRDQFDPEYRGEADGSGPSVRAILQAGHQADHPDVVHLVALYDEYLAYADQRIGGLVSEVEGAGMGERTLFLHTADHGEAFMQHGTIGHRSHVYEEQVRVPLILYAPGSKLPSGRVVRSRASLLDVFPTLVELLDLPAPPRSLRGRSVLPLLGEAEPAWDRPLFLTGHYREDAPPRQVGLVLDGHKLIVFKGKESSGAKLFDLRSDPAERRDLSAELPIRTEVMRDMLERWVRGSGYEENLAAASGDPELDPETRAEMNALGYTDDE